MVFVDSIPESKEDSKSLCEYYNILIDRLFSENGIPHKELNCNIAVIKDGIVANVFKGTTDEVNNSMLLTYDNFTQFHKNKIERLIPRDVDLKLLRAFRIILSFLSRSYLRESVKKSLRGTLQEKIDTLLLFDFGQMIDTGNKNVTSDNFYKALSFQIGQVLGLRDGLELYSKEDIYNTYSGLESFLMRDVTNYDFSELSHYVDILCTFAQSKDYFLDKNENTYTTIRC